jgi:hypothetical protein
MFHDLDLLLHTISSLDLLTLLGLIASMSWGAALGVAHADARRSSAARWLLGPAALILFAALVRTLALPDDAYLYILRALGLTGAQGAAALLAASMSASWSALALLLAALRRRSPDVSLAMRGDHTPLWWALGVVLVAASIAWLPLDALLARTLIALIALGSLPLYAAARLIDEPGAARDAATRGALAGLGLIFGLCIIAALPGLVLAHLSHQSATLTLDALAAADRALVTAVAVSASATLALVLAILADPLAALADRINRRAALVLLIPALAFALAAAVETSRTFRHVPTWVRWCGSMPASLGLDAAPFDGYARPTFTHHWQSHARHHTLVYCPHQNGLSSRSVADLVSTFEHMWMQVLVGEQPGPTMLLSAAAARPMLRGVSLLVIGHGTMLGRNVGEGFVGVALYLGADPDKHNYIKIHHVISEELIWSRGVVRPLEYAPRADGEIVAVVASDRLLLQDVLARCQRLGAAQCVLLQDVPSALSDLGPLTTASRALPNIVRRIIGRSLSDTRACYEQALATNPALTGRLVLEIGLRSSWAAEVKVSEDTLADPEVARCVVEIVSELRFPSAEGLIVTYPFVFEPSQGNP